MPSPLTFRLLFGTANERPATLAPAAAELIGMGWRYALHARSSIARGRVWQAEYMISGVRDHVLALVCLRHGVPAFQGRGMDLLPPEITTGFTGALVCSLDIAELRRAFGVISEALLVEIETGRCWPGEPSGRPAERAGQLITIVGLGHGNASRPPDHRPRPGVQSEGPVR